MSDDFGLLIAAAQTSLGAIPTVHDYRAKDVLATSAGVQASCALAVATEHLAVAIDQMVEAITEGNSPR